MVNQNDAWAIALAGGLTWALGLFVLGVGSIALNPWQTAVRWIGQLYLGYEPSIIGSLIGAVWGFADVFLGLFLFIWLYGYFDNRISN